MFKLRTKLTLSDIWKETYDLAGVHFTSDVLQERLEHLLGTENLVLAYDNLRKNWKVAAGRDQATKLRAIANRLINYPSDPQAHAKLCAKLYCTDIDSTLALWDQYPEVFTLLLKNATV